MSSVKLAEGLATAKGRQQYQKDEYLKNLRIASKLVQKQDSDIKEAKLNKKLGIPSIKALEQFTSAEQKLGDTSEQVRVAMENAGKLFKFQKDASTFVNSLGRDKFPGTNSSELQLFNRYFPSFSKDIQKTIDPATLTPAFLKQLWGQYANQVYYFELPNQVLDFKNPAERIAFQKYLYNFGELLKDRATTSGLSASEIGTLLTRIDDAVLNEDRAFLDEIGRKLGVRENTITPGVLTSIAVPPVAQLSTMKKKVSPTIPSNISELNSSLDDITDTKSIELEKDVRQLINAIETKTFDSTMMRQLYGLVANTYAKYNRVIHGDRDFQEGFRNLMIVLEMARHHIDGFSDFDHKTFNILSTEVGRRYSPDKIRDAINDFVYKVMSAPGKITPPSFAASTASSTSKSVVPVTPAVKKSRKKSVPTVGSGLPTLGSGLPRTMHEKVIFGEIMSGNNNKKLQRDAIQILKR